MVAMMDPFLVDGPSLLMGSFTPLQSSLISSIVRKLFPVGMPWLAGLDPVILPAIGRLRLPLRSPRQWTSIGMRPVKDISGEVGILP